MKDLVQEIASISGAGRVAFSPFDVKALLADDRFTVAEQVGEYFATAVPSDSLVLDLIAFPSAVDIVEQNTDYIPSLYVAPHGFITVAVDSCGDAFAVDVTNGRVYLLSHEKYEADGIHPGYDAERGGRFPTLEITRENIIATAEAEYSDIREFLENCRDFVATSGE